MLFALYLSCPAVSNNVILKFRLYFLSLSSIIKLSNSTFILSVPKVDIELSGNALPDIRQKKIQISNKNKRLYEFLKDKQDIKLQIILKDLHNEYLKSAQYKKDINKLESDNDDEYMNLYKKNAEGFINYFEDKKKTKN